MSEEENKMPEVSEEQSSSDDAQKAKLSDIKEESPEVKEEKTEPEPKSEEKKEEVLGEKKEEAKPKVEYVPDEAPDEVPEDMKPDEDEEEKKSSKTKRDQREKPAFDREGWKPRTEIGKKVKAGEIKDIDEILDHGYKIMEAEIVDALMPDLETDLLLIGQSKGKFGGGQRRVFKQTQKKTPEGNKPKFGTFAVVGNRNGYVGIGPGKAKETVPAREKAFRNAKLNITKVRRGCGSWECNCKTPHSIPYAVEGRMGSVYIKLMPAPKGAGLVAEKECQKMLEMAGIKDVYSLTLGQTQTKVNLINACMKALKQLMGTKVNPKYVEELGIVEGAIKKKKGAKDE